MRPPWELHGHPLKMGLRNCLERDWLPIEDPLGQKPTRQQQISKKRKLFAERYNEIFVTSEDCIQASEETFNLVTQHILKFHDQKTRFKLRHKNRVQNWHEAHPLEEAARLVPEDFTLIKPVKNKDSEKKWVLAAGAVAFPAHWSLKKKIGQELNQIHAPVPGYDTRLKTAVNKFFSTMRIGPITQRVNWSLQFYDKLFTPERIQPKIKDAPITISEIFLRIERQSFRKLEETEWILFTIRTSLVPLSEWQNVPDALNSLLTLLRQMPPAYREYRGSSHHEKIIENAVIASPNPS